MTVADVYKVLGDPTRLRLLRQIKELGCDCASACSCDVAGCCVGDLVEHVDVTAPTISHHLKELKQAGLITTTKQGRHVYCRVNQERFEAARDYLTEILSSERKGGSL